MPTQMGKRVEDKCGLRTRFTGCGKTQNFVIPRHAACRGISLFPGFDQREIPRFAQNDKINYFFRKLFRLRYEAHHGSKFGSGSGSLSPSRASHTYSVGKMKMLIAR